MAKYKVTLEDLSEHEVDADIMTVQGQGGVIFQNTIVEANPFNNNSFGGAAYRERYEAVGYFTGVKSVTKVE